MANEFKVKKGLIVEGSGGTILDIQGSVGQLFSITDSLTGDLFAVSDISGIPILNVNSSGAVDIDGDLSVTDDVTLSNFGAGYLKTNVNGVVSNTATIPWATVSSTPTTISGYGITDAFDGAYSSLSSIPSTFAPSAHNHDDRYYTETESDIRFLRQDGSGKEWVFEVSDEGNISGNKWYKIATVNNGNGGLHLRGLISNHVEGFAAQKFDIGIVGREGGSGREIEITGQVDILHNASSGSDKCGIRVIQSTSSDPYHKFDVYVRTTRYQMLRIHLTKSGVTSFYTSAANVTTEPAPVSGGNVELDTSTLQEGNYVIDDSTPREIYHEGHKPTYSELGAMAYSNLSGAPTLGTAAAAATGDFATSAQGTTADAALPKAGGTMTGDLTVEGSLTVGKDNTTPQVKLIYDDHPSGDVYDTLIEVGRLEDRVRAGNSAPTYLDIDGFGISFQAISDGVVYGMEEYATGHHRPVIAWGDDTSDSPMQFRFNNTSIFTVGHQGNITASGTIGATNFSGSSSGTNTGDQDLSSFITSQRAISSTPTDGATTTAISSDWAFDNVKTAVPANALFTDDDTTYSAGAGLDLTGTTFSVDTDLRDGITKIGKDSSNYIAIDAADNNSIDFYVSGDWVARMEADGDLHMKGDVIAFSDIFNP